MVSVKDGKGMDGGPGDRKKVLTFVLLASVIGGSVWWSMFLFLGPVAGEFNARVVSTFVAFLFIPLMMLALTGRRPELGGFDRGMVIGILGYQVFAVWLIGYFWVEPDYFKDFELIDRELLLYLALVMFYVPPVDLFTRRVVHLEMERAWDARTGFMMGTVAWLVGHGGEVIWLSELMGLVGSFLFILASGLVTGLIYMRYKNLLGLMVGHWMLNLVVAIVTSHLAR